MAGVATELVHTTLTKGKEILEGVKKGDGYLGSAVSKVEAPVLYVLDSSLGKSSVGLADRVVKIADRTVEGTMNSTVVKATGRAYTNRVLPVTTAVSKRVTNTSTAIKSTYTSGANSVSSVYQGGLEMADRQVERFMPDDDKELPLTPFVIAKKVTRRTSKRVRAVPANARKLCVAAKDTAGYALDQARPANVRKNTGVVYGRVITRADNLVDRVLPEEEDKFVATGPVTLAKKVTTRTIKRASAGVKAVARAIKNSPETFKKASRAAYTFAMKQAAEVKARVVQIADMRKQARMLTLEDFRPTLLIAQERLTPVVERVDAILLRFKLTTTLRDMFVANYKTYVAPRVETLLAVKNVEPSSEKTETEPLEQPAARLVFEE